MIGKLVPGEEFKKLLMEETRRDEFAEELKKELKALKPGECLVYETKEGAESSMSFSLCLTVKNLKLITRLGKVYAYKKC